MPTGELFPATWALQGVQSGLSARAALRDFRNAGGKVADSTWFKVYGEVAAQVSLREGIFAEPQSGSPFAHEIQQWSTIKAQGYAHQVEVLVRERATGEIVSIPYTGFSTELQNRQDVIDKALEVYSNDAAERYDQQILGAVYTGTYQAVRMGT
jgi:hypothetical protein